MGDKLNAYLGETPDDEVLPAVLELIGELGLVERCLAELRSDTADAAQRAAREEHSQRCRANGFQGLYNKWRTRALQHESACRHGKALDLATRQIRRLRELIRIHRREAHEELPIRDIQNTPDMMLYQSVFMGGE